jgi:hypothetical protein
MMSRRQFMARTSAAIDALVTELALTPSEQAGVKTRMARYNRDCGCAMGGVFLTAALLTCVAYIAVTADFAIGAIGAGIGFVMVSSLLGKAVGLVVASVRLGLLRRWLSRSARRTRGESHVYVH